MNLEELLVDKESPPTREIVEEWLGKRGYGYWTQLSEWIATSYPGIFSPEWLFGGKKHGWYLRYKKSKSLCQFAPRKKKFLVSIVFGSMEREEVENIKCKLSLGTKTEYENAKTFHDGKWLLLEVKNKTILKDIQKLLSVKRKITR